MTKFKCYTVIHRVFSQNFWWGGLLSGTIFGPRRGWSQMGGLASETESDDGVLGKIVH